jgi:predicted acetyltransferase
LPSEYQERFQEIIDYAFYPASGPQEYDDPETLASGPGQRFAVVETPGGIECEIHPGTMLRIVDVRHALETVANPRGCDGSVTLAVTDDTVDWNDDTFELTVSAGRGDCRRVEAEDPPVRVDIETLTQMLVGYHSVDDAQRLGALAVDTEDAETLLASWFPTRPVAPMDNF